MKLAISVTVTIHNATSTMHSLFMLRKLSKAFYFVTLICDLMIITCIEIHKKYKDLYIYILFFLWP